MAKKANIQKLKDDMLLKQGVNKHIFPATIDKAVATKWKGGYIALDKVLNQKNSYILSYTATSGENNYEYFLFSFANAENKNEFERCLKYSHSEFKKYVVKQAIDTDLESIEDYEEFSLNSVSCLYERLKYACIVNLVLDYVNLHSANIPEFVLTDEEGNEYFNGDTIYFNKYPGTLILSTRNLDINKHNNELIDLITRGGSHAFGLKCTSEEQQQEEFITMNSRWIYNDSILEYKNPSTLPDSLENTGISEVNVITDLLLNGFVKLNILPSDFPILVNETIINEYSAQVKKGIIQLKETYTFNGVEYRLVNGIPDTTVRVIFNPQSVPTFVSSDDTIELSNSNNWRGVTSFKAVNMDPTGTVTITTEPVNANVFKIGLEEWDEEIFDTELSITVQQLMDGVNIKVLPYSFTTNENSTIPYDGNTTQQTSNLVCTYEKDDTVIKKSLFINCAISEKSIRDHNRMFVNIITNTPTAQDPIVCANLLLKYNLEDIVISGASIYYHLFSNGAYSNRETEIPNVTFCYDNTFTEEDGEIIPRGNAVESLTLSADELTTRRLILALEIPRTYKSIPVTYGRVCIQGSTESGQRIVINVNFNFTNASDPTEQGNIVLLQEWLEDNGRLPIMESSNIDYNNIVQSLNPNVIGTTLNNNDLSNVTALSKSNFANMVSLEDTSFVSYLTNISEIPNECFLNDINITSIEIPDNIVSIGDSAFLGTGLTEITIPDSVTHIGKGALAGCPNLTTVVLGSGITEVTNDIFQNSTNITDVWLKADTGVQITGRMGGEPIPIFADDANITLHVPSTLVEIYSMENSPWMMYHNATVTVVPIQ